MPKKGGGEKAPCPVCGRSVQTWSARDVTILMGHKNKQGNWCPGAYLPPNIMHSTECPGEIIERDKWGRELSRRPCGAIITFGARSCRRCKTAFATGSLASAFRLVPHARAGLKRSWAIRFLKGGDRQR